MIYLYVGSFDPFTIGHMDVVNKINKIVKYDDRFIILVLNNENKKHMFNIEERKEFILKSINGMNVEVDCHNGFINEYFDLFNGEKIVLVRGLRNNTDFDYEMMYESFTRRFNVNTIYITPDPENAFISSTLVRNLILSKSDYSDLVPWL